MNLHKLRVSLFFAVMSCLVVLVVMTGATFAWFSQALASSNVLPLSGTTISSGEAELLIAPEYEGPYSEYWEFSNIDFSGTLEPMSTGNLLDFYVANAQDLNGITYSYTATFDMNRMSIHGEFFLRCTGHDGDIYFDPSQFTVGMSDQAIAAARLGISFTNAENQSTRYIFRLDEFADLNIVESKQTTYLDNVVVSGLEYGAYMEDPSISCIPYMAVGNREDGFTAGAQKLISMKQDEILFVECWLYLEGCDPQCINAVAAQEISFRLAFAAVDAG